MDEILAIASPETSAVGVKKAEPRKILISPLAFLSVSTAFSFEVSTEIGMFLFAIGAEMDLIRKRNDILRWGDPEELRRVEEIAQISALTFARWIAITAAMPTAGFGA
jgi:hypothetical protein